MTLFKNNENSEFTEKWAAKEGQTNIGDSNKKRVFLRE